MVPQAARWWMLLSIKGRWLRWWLEHCLEQCRCGRAIVEAEVDGVGAKRSDSWTMSSTDSSLDSTGEFLL